ncbi:hypothetical protein [uncultured Maribacter sp.]|nr:hypothetical protein [uncultured Maribacter sp.]
MKKKGQIIKISGGTFNELVAKDITFEGENIDMTALINVNEEGEQGIDFL